MLSSSKSPHEKRESELVTWRALQLSDLFGQELDASLVLYVRFEKPIDLSLFYVESVND